MLAKDIKVGGLYCAKVSGYLTTVRVDAIRDGRGVKGNATYYDVTNLKTGRRTTFRSAAKFRWVEDGKTGPGIRPSGLQPGEASELMRSELAVAADLKAEGKQCSDPTPVASTGDGERGVASFQPVTQVLINRTTDLGSRLSALTSNPDDSPHLIVEARAGTGKTTTLIEGLKLLRGGESSLTPSPQQRAVWDSICLSRGKAKTVCFVAFNKSIATELQQRVPAGVEAMTMHSLGYRAVTKALGRQEPNQWVVQDLTAELMGMDIREAKRKKGPVINGVDELVSLCKMNLLDGTREDLDRLSAHYDVELNGSRAEVYDLVPRVLERCKAPKGKVTFDDMIWLPVVLGLAVPKYDLLLVDEAQDLNRCQQALARKAGHRLILVGDPRQAIYGFAGADSESMNRMYEELSGFLDDSNDSANLKCQVLPLTVTRRCGKAIVDEARKLVPDFDAHESNPDGLVRTAMRATRERPVIKEADNYANQVGPGDFILCRTNAPLVSECFKFIRQGRKANIQGRDIGKGLIKTLEKLSGGQPLLRVEILVAALSDWLASETAKEQAKRNPSESKITGLQDRHDCLMCFTEGEATVEGVKRKIEQVFTDDKTSPGIKLSSIHKAKGLEAKRVFILQVPFGRRDRMQAWEVQQEANLEYVAITRAIEELVFVG